MCMSRVFLESLENGEMVMEEAAKVRASGHDVIVSSLFGEEKTVAGHVIAEVNLDDAYVVLRKAERKEHSHSHESAPADTDAGKLRIVLEHQLKHNDDHVRDLDRWLHRAEDAGLSSGAGALKDVLDLSGRIGERLREALEAFGAGENGGA